jgi:hypothetical protein
MTPTQLRECAAAYGGATRLAHAIGVDDSLMRRWQSGERPMPAWLPDALRDILIIHAAELRNNAARCEALAREIAT